MTEVKKWEFKLPDDKTCWKDLKTYSADTCADDVLIAAGSGLDLKPIQKVGEFASLWLLQDCGASEMTMHYGEDAEVAKTTPLQTFEYGTVKGAATCTKLSDFVWVTFTSPGWTENKVKVEESGAKGSIAAAFAAGALAIAATQF